MCRIELATNTITAESKMGSHNAPMETMDSSLVELGCCKCLFETLGGTSGAIVAKLHDLFNISFTDCGNILKQASRQFRYRVLEDRRDGSAEILLIAMSLSLL